MNWIQLFRNIKSEAQLDALADNWYQRTMRLSNVKSWRGKVLYSQMLVRMMFVTQIYSAYKHAISKPRIKTSFPSGCFELKADVRIGGIHREYPIITPPPQA